MMWFFSLSGKSMSPYGPISKHYSNGQTSCRKSRNLKTNIRLVVVIVIFEPSVHPVLQVKVDDQRRSFSIVLNVI